MYFGNDRYIISGATITHISKLFISDDYTTLPIPKTSRSDHQHHSHAGIVQADQSLLRPQLPSSCSHSQNWPKSTFSHPLDSNSSLPMHTSLTSPRALYTSFPPHSPSLPPLQLSLHVPLPSMPPPHPNTFGFEP